MIEPTEAEETFLENHRLRKELMEARKEINDLKAQIKYLSRCKHERQQGTAKFVDGVFTSEMHCVSCGEKIPPIPYFPFRLADAGWWDKDKK